jgi:hypothetical protein
MSDAGFTGLEVENSRGQKNFLTEFAKLVLIVMVLSSSTTRTVRTVPVRRTFVRQFLTGSVACRECY